MPERAVQQTESIQRPGSRETMRALFVEISEKCDLPPLPAVALKAMQLARDPDTRAQELAHVVSTDAAIAARVLRISCSAMYVRRQPPRTLEEAILTVGFGGLRKILIAASARSAYRADDAVAEKLWEHSLATALAADELAAEAREARGGPSFIAGLLHDIGRLVMHLSDPEAYARIGHSEPAREEELFGVAHHGIGGCLAENWGLEDDVVEAVLFHHTEASPLAERVAQADRIAHAMGHGCVSEPLDDASREPLPEEVVTRVRETYAAEAALFD